MPRVPIRLYRFRTTYGCRDCFDPRRATVADRLVEDVVLYVCKVDKCKYATLVSDAYRIIFPRLVVACFASDPALFSRAI